MAHLTEIIRPSGNANALWNTNAYTSIDEVIQEPTAGDANFALATDSDDFEVQRWQFTNPSGNYSSIGGFTLWSYVVTSAGVGIIGTSIAVSGNNMPETQLDITNVAQWFKQDFTPAGSPTIADLDTIELRVDAKTRSKSNDIQFNAAYIVVSGVLDEGGGPAGAVARNPNVANDIFSSPIVIGL